MKHFNVFCLKSERESHGASDKNTSSSLDNDRTSIPVQDIDEGLEVLCARTEALHVHGYHTVAGKLAVKLAENILSDGNKSNTSGGTRNSNRDPSTVPFTNTILVKAAFLCNVLAEDLHCHHLAFRVGMLGLEMPRQPAKSKALEVKLSGPSLSYSRRKVTVLFCGRHSGLIDGV